VELLAFGEYTPLWDYIPPLQRFPRGLTPGEAPRVVTVANTRVGVLNCYEDVLDQYAIKIGRDRPDVLVNVTNDAWFGDTSEPWLHEATSRMRSVETRRDLVRAVNTGTSSHTSATGESFVRTPTLERTSFIAEVRVLSVITPWVRFGDWVTPCLVGALLGVVFALRRR
jgi:apolipoprotein N-acyltransferase